jgi:hypothetical protein
MPVGWLSQRARVIASRQLFGGPTFFSLADFAIQHDTDINRAKREKGSRKETSH